MFLIYPHLLPFSLWHFNIGHTCYASTLCAFSDSSAFSNVVLPVIAFHIFKPVKLRRSSLISRVISSTNISLTHLGFTRWLVMCYRWTFSLQCIWHIIPTSEDDDEMQSVNTLKRLHCAELPRPKINKQWPLPLTTDMVYHFCWCLILKFLEQEPCLPKNYKCGGFVMFFFFSNCFVFLFKFRWDWVGNVCKARVLNEFESA